MLLTIALIMRANYSVTRQRRADRVIGTLFGCLLAAALLAVVPPGYLLAIVAISVGVSHAFAAVNYRVTAVSASISSLLLLHFIQPAAQHVLLERMVDTLIGAAISYAFAFLLPNWERNALPGALASLLKADAEFAKQALSMTRLELPYRVARKTLFDSVAALSGLVRRMADEPQTGRDLLTRLNNLLSANYLLLSDLSSMQVLFGLRRSELDEARANAYLAEIGDRVDTYLTTRGGDLKSPERLTRVTRDDLLKPNGMSVLKRRLIHIDHAAQRVARLADEIRG
ncbi:MAG TPA: FUSC family protein [Steroidobacteraceae bacterium]